MNTKRLKLAMGLALAIVVSLGIPAFSIPIVESPSSSSATQHPVLPANEGIETPQIVSAAVSNLQETHQSSVPERTETAIGTPDESLVKRIDRDARVVENGFSSRDVEGITATIVYDEQPSLSNSDFDAGGPYGGPDCYEGSCLIHFEITTSDPTLLFFRWDFNNDSFWDTPWMTEKSYDRLFFDNLYSDAIAEGWDGTSYRTRLIYGNNLDELEDVAFYAYPANVGWKFKAREDIDAIGLGYYQYFLNYPGLAINLWSFASQTRLGSCTPYNPKFYAWNWCNLAAPIHLAKGVEYMISYHKAADYYPYWTMLSNPDVPWDKVEYQGSWYAWGLPQRIPDTEFGGGTGYVPMVDFRWRKIIIEPLTKRDFALVDVRNVPPTPFNITAETASATEGLQDRFTAWFNDPGLEDEWQFRWSFDNSTWTSWKDVKKTNGGAKVLLYHSMTNDIIDFKKKIIDVCGKFCLSVDDYDFGLLGPGKQMTLDELMAYDVIYVETNYFIDNPEEVGNLLADYMDQKGNEGSGGVVTGNGPYIENSEWDIQGRYFDDEYNPVEKASYSFGYWNLGTIYVPGHPILDGVASLTSYMHINAEVLTPDATKIADWDSGKIAIATKLNPIVNNGARSVALPWSAWYNYKGHAIQTVVNALRWASRQPNPMPLTMPIKLQWTSHTYGDDDPVTASPWDNFTLALEVKDDDHLKIEGVETQILSEDFEKCDGYTFPLGWTNEPYYGWQCLYSSDLKSKAATNWYYFNEYNTSLLSSPVVDFGTHLLGRVEWRQYWHADYPDAIQDGYVEASVDGGQNYTTVLKEFHHNQPGNEIATYSAGINELSGQFRLRYRIYSGNDWSWMVDDVKIFGVDGHVEWGLGNASGAVTVNNVEPSVVGGPDSDTAHAGIPYDFTGLAISDPALMQETEWFAYKFDFGDGTPAQWVYKGKIVPPKQDVLIIHSMCTSGASCADMTNLIDMLNGLDVVGSVTTYNFFEKLSAPTLDYMLNFDVIMFASNYGYISYPPYDFARIIIGNNMASYLDQHAGGVVTWMLTFDLSQYYGDMFSLMGRYIDQDYGPFEKGEYTYGDAFFPPVIHQPNHPVMEGINASDYNLVWSNMIHSGNLPVTSGGLRLASWYDGGAAVGVKDFGNDGRRSCAINAFVGQYGGPSAPLLLRNCIGWAIGGLPTPEIPTVSHTWMNQGSFTVDISIIDDDMGWTWDSINGIPVQDPAYPQTIAHRYIQIDVQL